jgi:hypothetical protein
MNQQEVMSALAAPFPEAALHWKPQVVKGDKALGIPYLDARDVMDRLDAVLGVQGWQDSYQILPGGSVVCTLRVRLGGDWVQKMDVGAPSEQPDPADKLKAAVSDGLKRAAIKFGVGRYLYRVPPVWWDFDPQRKQFRTRPKLPLVQRPAAAPVAVVVPVTAAATETPQQKAARIDAVMAADGYIAPGVLRDHVARLSPDADIAAETAAFCLKALLCCVHNQMERTGVYWPTLVKNCGLPATEAGGLNACTMLQAKDAVQWLRKQPDRNDVAV